MKPARVKTASRPAPSRELVRSRVRLAEVEATLRAIRRGEVDTVVVAGCTTSGCVRATVVDSLQFNFRTVVIEECVGDRAQEPHQANLFDIQQKYADVLRRDDFLRQLAGGAAT